MKACPERSAALALLRKYNAEPFHIQHGLTVEGVMRWYAHELGYGEDADFWAAVGLLHDVDFEKWPEAHCKKARSCWRRSAAATSSSTRYAVTATACAPTWSRRRRWRRCSSPPDELTGLIGAAALMRPSKSCQDMEVSSLKKFKDKEIRRRLLPGCDPPGAENLGWTLEELMDKTSRPSAAAEESVAARTGGAVTLYGTEQPALVGRRLLLDPAGEGGQRRFS